MLWNNDLSASLDSQAPSSSEDTGVNGHAAVEQVQETITAFKPFGSLALFNYLTPLVERTDAYRAIMRVFYQRSRVYRYQLTSQDVLDAVREELRQDYHLEQCKADLDSLVRWGNLATIYDTGRVTTIADLRSPVLRYQAMPEALEIESFLASHAHIGASEGGLRQGDLPLLDELLRQLDTWLQADHSQFTPEHSQKIADQWYRAFTTWERVTHDAAQYLGSMNQSAQQITDLTTYLVYKGIVVTYIQSFAQQLVQYSNAIRLLLLGWTASGKKTRLLRVITSTPPPIQTQAEHIALWHEDIRQQIEALQDWFLQQSNVTLFSRAANDAIQKVVHRAHTLASSMRPQTDYVSMLLTLASQFMQVSELETAQQLYAAAFASATPVHLAESFTGTPEVADEPGERSPWRESAPVVRNLRPIYKGNVERAVEQPMRHGLDAVYQMKQQHDAEAVLQRQRYARLFREPLLDLGQLGEITPEERAALSEMLDGCLSSPALEYQLPDGSVVTLLNRRETAYVALRARDGVLLLPRYRLQHRTEGTARLSRFEELPELWETEVVS
ncbi:MAG TPA: TIGR02677 family protein [Ktedonobacteraceae bacterium]